MEVQDTIFLELACWHVAERAILFFQFEYFCYKEMTCLSVDNFSLEKFMLKY